MKIQKLLTVLAFLSLLVAYLPSINGEVIKTDLSKPIAPLPAVVFLKCKWEKIQGFGAGGFYLDIWLIGFGRHRVEIKRYCDFDGDGIWDFNDDSPNVWDIIVGVIPFHHFKGLETTWSGYPGKSHVKIKIWVDGFLAKDKDFYAPWD